MTRVMNSKKQKQWDSLDMQITQPDVPLANVIVSRPDVPVPRVRTFTAKPCSVCVALREAKDEAKGKNFSRVYGTVGDVRYCRCDFCGNTWKDAETT